MRPWSELPNRERGIQISAPLKSGDVQNGAREGRISVALARSTLSTPTPALPTTLRRPLEASKTSLVTCRIPGSWT